MTLEGQQEHNLHCNWDLRKDLSKRIGGEKGYDVFDYRDQDGRRVFYIVYKGFPVGYVSCFDTPQGVQVNSTFIREVARRKGLGYMAYKVIITQVGAIISDFERSEGAEALWQKLKRDPLLNVGIYDDNCYIGRRK